MIIQISSHLGGRDLGVPINYGNKKNLRDFTAHLSAMAGLV
jgi:hypothetical protein